MAPTRTVHSKQATLKFGGQSSTKLGLSSTPPPPSTSPTKKRKSRKVVDPDRIETDVLLSIKPVHLANIAKREKNHEYRKYRLRDGVERLWFYESQGTGKGEKGRGAITHIATIPPTERRTPGNVPEVPFGIGNKDFNDGLKESKYGYPILELYELVKPLTSTEMEAQWGVSIPMGFCYVKKGLWESIWGDDHGGDKVRKVF